MKARRESRTTYKLQGREIPSLLPRWKEEREEQLTSWNAEMPSLSVRDESNKREESNSQTRRQGKPITVSQKWKPEERREKLTSYEAEKGHHCQPEPEIKSQKREKSNSPTERQRSHHCELEIKARKQRRATHPLQGKRVHLCQPGMKASRERREIHLLGYKGRPSLWGHNESLKKEESNSQTGKQRSHHCQPEIKPEEAGQQLTS